MTDTTPRLSRQQALRLVEGAYLAAATGLIWLALYYLPVGGALFRLQTEESATHREVVERKPNQTRRSREIRPLNQPQSLLAAQPGGGIGHGSTRSIRSTAKPTSASRRARVTASAGAAGSAPAKRMVIR